MSPAGKLIVLEGPDGVGKSKLAAELTNRLRADGLAVRCLAFPGSEPGTLGNLVYQLHHDAQGMLGSEVSAAALQTLHVAAHLDAIERQILPSLFVGESIILDRYWWSTWVYGMVADLPENVLTAMINLERSAWGTVNPAVAFLVTAARPWREGEELERWRSLANQYAALAERESERYPIERIANDGSVADAVERLATTIAKLATNTGGGSTRPFEAPRGRATAPGARQMVLGIQAESLPFESRNHRLDSSFAPAIPTAVFDTYWRFAVERQNVFFRRLEGGTPPWTDDPILRRHRFTNAYRASDRVSQYLIRHVQYAGGLATEELFFRTILFKLFNRIETWEMLEQSFGEIAVRDFTPERYERILQRAMQAGQPIYSGAYIMPAAPGSTGHLKHSGHLRLLERMLRDELPARLSTAGSLREAFELLRAYPMMGDFLAFQYIIDLNYSPLLDFSEMEFVVQGPGARSGIRKCFRSLGGLSEADVIRLVAKNQQDEFARRGLAFRDLWGRPLQLVDCQNLFCEVDKYARVAHPDIGGKGDRTRIKQVLRPLGRPPTPWYPPKWGINERIADAQEAESAPDRR